MSAAVTATRAIGTLGLVIWIVGQVAAAISSFAFDGSGLADSSLLLFLVRAGLVTGIIGLLLSFILQALARRGGEDI